MADLIWPSIDSSGSSVAHGHDGDDTAASCLRRVIESFGTERASEDLIFNNQSLPFLQQVTKSGATYKFIQAVVYTPQEINPIPFVSPTGFLNADRSPFVAHIMTQVQPLHLPVCISCTGAAGHLYCDISALDVGHSVY